MVVGSGCAGYNAADCLWNLGVRDVVLLTEGVRMGTSRNTGSDKQTYYKLSLSGSDGDSVRDLAETLYGGGGVDGDIALCEAAGSARGFLKLVQLGVPFPTNEYGEYVGYQTTTTRGGGRRLRAAHLAPDDGGARAGRVAEGHPGARQDDGGAPARG